MTKPTKRIRSQQQGKRSRNPRKRTALRAIKGPARRAGQRRPEAPSIKPAGSLPPATQQQGSDGIGGFGSIWFAGHGESNPALQGSTLWKTLSEALANSTIIATAVRYSLNLISGVEWECTPYPHAKDQALAKKCAETGREGLVDADMSQPFSLHAAKQALHAWLGFSLHNWFWRKRSDGLTVISDLRHRPQSTISRWDIPVEGEPWIGVEQTTRGGGQYYVERSRLWYTADLMISDRPQGVGLLRHVIETSRQTQHLEEIEGYGFDANLRGVPVGRAPLSELWNYAKGTLKYSDDDAEAWVEEQTAELQAMLQNHAKSPDQGMLLDSAVFTGKSSDGSQTLSAVPKYAIDLLQGDDMGLEAVAKAIERKTREMARVMSFEWALLGEGDAGSNAMHVDKTAQYGSFLNAITMRLGITGRNDILRPLIGMNHGREAAESCTPLLTPSQISTADIRAFTGAILDLKQAGAYIPPDDPIWNIARKRMRVPPQQKIPPDVAGGLLRPPMPPPFGAPQPPKPGAPQPPKPGAPQPPKPGADGDDPEDEDTDQLRAQTEDEQPPKKRRRSAA